MGGEPLRPMGDRHRSHPLIDAPPGTDRVVAVTDGLAGQALSHGDTMEHRPHGTSLGLCRLWCETARN
jgi:hypothetical protein